MIKLIAAVGPRGLIGKGPGLPWHIPAELALFKQLTWGHSLLMGGTTYRHLPRPLINRTIYVWTHNPAAVADEQVLTTPEAVEALLARFATSDQTLWIAGGKTVYERYYQWAEELVVSEVSVPVGGDVYLNWDLTPYQRELWQENAAFKTYRYYRPRDVAFDNRKKA